MVTLVPGVLDALERAAVGGLDDDPTVTLAAAVPVWQTPTLTQAVWLAAIGTLASLANLSVAQAFKEADLTAILPLDFTKLIWASGIGYLAFAEEPSPWTWFGGAIIFSAATYIAFRERRTGAAPDKT